MLLFGNLMLSAQTPTFSYTGALQSYTVPARVSSIQMTVVGARRGTVNYGGSSPRGAGTIMQGGFAVTPSQVISIVVGELGVTGTYVARGVSFILDNTLSTLYIAGGDVGYSGSNPKG